MLIFDQTLIHGIHSFHIYTILSLKYYSEFRGCSGYSSFPHQQKWQPQYKWNIVESGVKHHNPNPEFRNWSHISERRIWDKKQIIGWGWKFTPRWRILYIFLKLLLKIHGRDFWIICHVIQSDYNFVSLN